LHLKILIFVQNFKVKFDGFFSPILEVEKLSHIWLYVKVSLLVPQIELFQV
jgi:hypothetical protein